MNLRSGRLPKRLPPTGRGAAASTPELGEPRPAAEAHVVRPAALAQPASLIPSQNIPCCFSFSRKAQDTLEEHECPES
jgi:hypothetical protein